MVQLNDIVYLPYTRGRRDDKIGLVVRTDSIAVLLYEEPNIHNYLIDEHRYEYYLISRVDSHMCILNRIIYISNTVT